MHRFRYSSCTVLFLALVAFTGCFAKTVQLDPWHQIVPPGSSAGLVKRSMRVRPSVTAPKESVHPERQANRLLGEFGMNARYVLPLHAMVSDRLRGWCLKAFEKHTSNPLDNMTFDLTVEIVDFEHDGKGSNAIFRMTVLARVLALDGRELAMKRIASEANGPFDGENVPRPVWAVIEEVCRDAVMSLANDPAVLSYAEGEGLISADYEPVVVPAAGNVAPVAADDSRPRLAVLDFEESGQNLDPDVGKFLAAKMLDAFAAGRYARVERQALEALMAEQNLAASDLADDAKRAGVGKIQGVDVLAIGSVTRLENQYRVSVRLVDASTGKVLQSGSVNGRLLRDIETQLPGLANTLQAP